MHIPYRPHPIFASACLIHAEAKTDASSTFTFTVDNTSLCYGFGGDDGEVLMAVMTQADTSGTDDSIINVEMVGSSYATPWDYLLDSDSNEGLTESRASVQWFYFKPSWTGSTIELTFTEAINRCAVVCWKILGGTFVDPAAWSPDDSSKIVAASATGYPTDPITLTAGGVGYNLPARGILAAAVSIDGTVEVGKTLTWGGTLGPVTNEQGGFPDNEWCWGAAIYINQTDTAASGTVEAVYAGDMDGSDNDGGLLTTITLAKH